MKPRSPRHRMRSLEWCLVCPGLALALSSTSLPPARAAEPRPPGEKIEFSPPSNPATVKPMTERDLGRRPFNFQRRDATPEPDISPAVMLPPPDQVNQARALQELLERGSFMNSLDPNGNDRSLDLNLRPDSDDLGADIDDLFEERSTRGRLQRGDDLDLGNAFGAPDDERRGNRRAPRRDRNWEGSIQDFGRGFERDRNRDGSPLNPLSAEEPKFLQGLDAPIERDRNLEATGRQGSRRSEGYLGFGDATRRSGFDSRDGDDAKSRSAERMESFRRMIGGGLPTDRVGGPSDGSLPGVAGLGGSRPGPATGPGREPFATSGSPGGEPSALSDPVTAARALALPKRPLTLDGTPGTIPATARREGVASSETPLRPMELFQRKHDPRIPARVF